MRIAMKATAPHRPLERCVGPLPEPGSGEVRLQVLACGICRTDLHLLDGELPQARFPVVPGHEVVGVVEASGMDAGPLAVGQRVGVPWLGGTCGRCRYCRAGRENLCDRPAFTGCTYDGGYATHLLARAAYCVPLPETGEAASLAPLLCAGLIGWRALRMAGSGKRLGLYGFGAAAHIVIQLACWQGRRVSVFTRPGDTAMQAYATSLGAAWAGDSDAVPPSELDAAIIFAADGRLVPTALRSVAKGGRVVCAGIHMSDVPTFPYALLWGERELCSVANLTRADAEGFFDVVARAGVRTRVTVFDLDRANEAVLRVRAGGLQGAAVLRPAP